MKSKLQKVHNRKEMKAKTPRRWYKHKDGDSEEGLDYLFTGEVIREAEAGGTEDTCESWSKCAQETTNYQNKTGNEYQTEESQEEMQSKI